MPSLKGAVFPSEYQALRDDQTGTVVHQLTSSSSINHHLYFLNSSFTPDGKSLIFTSYRSAHPQLYEVAFPTGPIRQLTVEEGMHAFSGCLSRDGKQVFFTRRGGVWSISRDTLQETCLGRFDDAQLGECSLSPSGEWIVTAIRQSSFSGIAFVPTIGREPPTVVRWPRTVIHPQFHPLDENLVEFASDPAPRMHLLYRDSGKIECLHEHGNDEFVVHETFLGETGDIVFTVWPFSLGRFDLRNRRIQTLARLNAWHISPNRNGNLILCDTNHPDVGIRLIDVSSGRHEVVCYPKSSCQGSQWRTSRYALPEDWARAAEEQAAERGKTLSWMEMKTDTVYGPQWTHPHPSWSHDESKVVYTSDVSGHPQVYVAEIPEAMRKRR
ncbi:MAG: oligogalacturonate lyase family protein [Acidobacteriota bacterium]